MEDLISYSFQVARGMEFLSSRKVSLALYCCSSLPGLDMWAVTWQTHVLAINPLFLVFACTYVLKYGANIMTDA